MKFFIWSGCQSLTHWSNLFGNFFWLLTWELMDATPTNNRSVLPRTTVTLSQNTTDCICLWALPSTCCQRFDHLFVWILPFDLPGLVRPTRSWSFRQYSSQGRGITQAPPPLQGCKLKVRQKIIKSLHKLFKFCFSMHPNKKDIVKISQPFIFLRCWIQRVLWF